MTHDIALCIDSPGISINHCGNRAALGRTLEHVFSDKTIFFHLPGVYASRRSQVEVKYLSQKLTSVLYMITRRHVCGFDIKWCLVFIKHVYDYLFADSVIEFTVVCVVKLKVYPFRSTF